jgi:carbon-monoxide dehydrogenase medium subunit
VVSLILQPRSLDEVVEALAQHGDDAKVIAGGTAVVLMLQNRLIAPEVLISLAGIPGLDFERLDEQGALRLGALTTIRAAERSSLVRENHAALAETYGKVANVRIRNAATVGGNLTEADYASDPPALLMAQRARVAVTGPGGHREIPLTELFTGFYETSVAHDELVTELIVPPLPASARCIYLKFTTRSVGDRPCLGVAAYLDRAEDGHCRELRVVIGAVDETPREIVSVEGLATGHVLTDELIDAIADQYSREIDPLSDLRGSAWYRTEMIRVFVRRALRELSERE